MIAVIDNYDSFVYNLYQYLGTLDPCLQVFRNDAISPCELHDLAPDAIVLSPGPGRPANAGCCKDVVQQLGADIPLLGVCLGHQAIVEAYGGHVGYALRPMHGKSSKVQLDLDCELFVGLSQHTQVARYHSLAADPQTLPPCLEVVAKTSDGEIMAVRHHSHPIFGVQFHPESVLTLEGMAMITNFVNFAQHHKRKVS